MAARRRKRRRRRGRFGFLYKLFSTVLILSAIVAGCIVFFRVEDITVSGNGVYTQEQIIAAAGVETGDNLFLINEVKAAQSILNQLPYVNNVNLRRALPNGLVITVTECTPVGVLEGEKGVWWVIDSRGKLLEQGGSELTQLYPRITGLTAQMPAVGASLTVEQEEQNKLDSLKQVLSSLEDRGMIAQVQSIDLSGLSEIHVSYEERFTVYLPMYSGDFPGLIHNLQAAADRLDAGQTGVIDLTLKGERWSFIPN